MSLLCDLVVVFNCQDGIVVFILESKHLNSFSYRHGQIQVMEPWAMFLAYEPVINYTGEKLTRWSREG